MADNKKTYTIQINGIDQSIKQVDALSDALQYLDKKIKDLESRSVSVTSSQSGNGARNAELQTEDKLLKQIQNTEQQIRDARREDYQSLLAQKDILKDITDEAKQRAAAERLSTNNYANTMKGMKQELADIKSVMQTTSLESDTFNELTKRASVLTNKLKELEQAYGQFGRNVGNYPNSMGQDFGKLQIEVNGAIREFDNARQALKELTNERNTLKLMGQDFGNLDEVVKTLKSDIKDMEMSSVAMDNLLDSMEGLIALGSSAEGFAALFGFDNDQIQQTIQKLVALQNILQGIEVIKKQMQASEGIGGLFAKGNAAIDKFSASLLGVSNNAKAAKKGLTQVAAAETTTAVAAKGATVAVKALSFALKTVGIGIILTAVAFLVEGLQSLIEWFTKADEATENAKKINEAAAKAYGEAKSQITSYTARVKDFNGTKQQEKKLVDELNSNLGKQLGTYKTLAEWQKVLEKNGDAYCESMLRQARAQAALNIVTEAYINLQKVQANIASGEYHHWYQTVAGDREADAKELQKANEEIAKAEGEWRRLVNESIQFDKTHSLGDFSPQVDTAKKSGAKLGKTIKDIEADIAKARIDAMKQGLTKTLAQLELERSKRIAEAKKTGKLVNEQIEQINKTYQQKIFDARVAYHVNLLNEEKKYAEKVEKLNEDMFQKEVEIAKKRNELNLEQNIDNMTFYKAVGSTRTSDGDVLDMSNLYARGLKNLTYDYNFELPSKTLAKYKELVDELENVKYEMSDIDTSTEEGAKAFDEYSKKAIDLTKKIEEYEKKYPKIEYAVENVVATTLNEGIENRTAAVEGYYSAVLDYTKEAADKEIRIEKEKLDTEYDLLEKNEEKRHRLMVSRYYDNKDLSQDDKDRYNMPRTALQTYLDEFNKGSLSNKTTNQIGTFFSEYRDLMDKWIENLKKGVQEGKYTWEEYNEFMNQEAIQGYLKAKDEYDNFMTLYNKMSDGQKKKNENSLKALTTNLNNAYVAYLDNIRAEQETHNNQMKVMESKYNLDVEKAEKDHQDKLKQANADYHSQMISEYERAMSAISSKIDKAEKKNALGIINYGATKKALKDLQDSVKTTLDKIAADKKQLVEKLANGEISFGDFTALMDQLNTLEVQAKDTAQNVSKNLKELFTNWIQSINDIANQLGSSLSSLIGSFGDYADVQYENQINNLQKFIDEYEEKLNEQKEITQKHSSEVDSIEQELANARGDRRQHLIDQLNAEMAAQRASLAQEKKTEQEKKKMEADKEKLEKKRFEEQKKIQTAQAIMSGALAVTNALAVEPFWVGVAMAAMAAAAAAVQVATIQAQKYAEGGVLQGKSHAQGGIKVLGGRAEVEGGEYITNKVTTSKNIDLLEYINTKKRKVNLEDLIEFYGGSSPIRKNIQGVRTKFADGGVVPTLRNDITLNDRMLAAFEDYSNRPVQVAVVDIIDRTEQVNNVKVMAGLDV